MVRSVLISGFIAACCLVMPAQADGARLQQIDTAHRFYQALGAAPETDDDNTRAETIAALLTADATIELTDFDVVQNRDEFIDSLVELDDALSGSRITHRVETADGPLMGVLVCYEFESNSVLNRETLTFDGGLISVVTQVPIADKCDAL
ncbi:MAG: hypothetical protein WA921_08680 [Ahrensia sp.]